MLRQYWLFLAPDDEASFLAGIESIDPGTFAVPSRYIRGDANGLLSRGTDGLEFPILNPREQRRYLFHRKHSSAVKIFPVTEGPLLGASYIDETRSDCLMLVRPEPEGRRLAPSRLTGELVRFSGGDKEKRSPLFVAWVNRVMKALRDRYPKTAVDFIHVAQAAEAFALGGGELTYLHQRIDLHAPGRS